MNRIELQLVLTWHHDVVMSHGDGCLQTWKNMSHSNLVFVDTIASFAEWAYVIINCPLCVIIVLHHCCLWTFLPATGLIIETLSILLATDLITSCTYMYIQQILSTWIIKSIWPRFLNGSHFSCFLYVAAVDNILKNVQNGSYFINFCTGKNYKFQLFL